MGKRWLINEYDKKGETLSVFYKGEKSKIDKLSNQEIIEYINTTNNAWNFSYYYEDLVIILHDVLSKRRWKKILKIKNRICLKSVIK